MNRTIFTDKAQELLKHLLINDPEIETRIDSGIENNRKGWGEIELIDSAGSPVKSASIKLRQTSHEFHFGCNAFLLDQLPEAEKNARYRELFSDLFNLAVVPFYWSDLEPQRGELRFEKNSPPVYRRPPPDLVLEFCDEHNITPKGHPLLWHLFRPQWLSTDEREMRIAIRKRFEQISARYAQRISIWDVCNEAQTMSTGRTRWQMPENHLEYAFKLAEEFFPNCTRIYNDDRIWYRYSRTYTPVYLLMKMLIESGHKVDGLGLQFHMFSSALYNAFRFLNPRNLLNCFDLYAKLGIPLNISEITIIGSQDMGDGDAFQELVAQRLYRLWFSHPAMNGITWWNLVDNTAAYAPLGDGSAGENLPRAGLVNYDMTPKPAYLALRRLIREEWQTNCRFEYESAQVNKFRGFYGNYEVTVQTNSGSSTHSVTLSKSALNHFKLVV